MRFYRVAIKLDHGSSAGFEWFATKADAQKFLRDAKHSAPEEQHEIDIIEVAPTRAGILSALNIFAGHPDNG